MKKNLLIKFFICSFLFLNFAQADGKISVQLVVNVTHRTPANQKIYITGPFCHWDPQCVLLKKVGSDAYLYEFEVPEEQEWFEFKVTRGRWETEAAHASGQPLKNIGFHLRVKNEDGTYVVPASKRFEFVTSIVNWKDLNPFGLTGELDCLENVYSPELNNQRQVCIWLPPSYRTRLDLRYPVVYAHDGQNLFLEEKSSSGVEWEVDDAMTTLIRTGKINEAIVVGVSSINKVRMDEYDYQKDGKKYADFLVHTLKPLIDRKYRTQIGREHTYAMGSSMGGLISFALGWKYSKAFSKIAALSLPIFIHGGSIYQTIGSDLHLQYPVQFYIDHGTHGYDREYGAYAIPFMAIMKKMGFGPLITYQEYPYADHNEADWARRIADPLKFLFESN